jgi:hypothetical protein
MKTMNFKFMTILIISIGSIAGCSKDEKKVSQFVGNYVITEALVAEPFNVPITDVGNFPVPAGTSITAAIQGALLSSVTCSSADKTWVEIREDFSLYMSCEGADPLNAGTWSEGSSGELLLNLNTNAVPSPIALTVTDVVKSGSTLTGLTSVPLPKAMVQALLTPYSLVLDPSAPAVFIVKFSLKFTQK